MQIISNLGALFFLITAFFAGARADEAKCTVKEIEALGYTFTDGPTDEQLKVLVSTTTAIKKAGKTSVTQTEEKHRPKVTKKLEKELMKVGIKDVTSECISCFAESVQCVVSHCKGACFTDEFSDDCSECFKKNCKDKFTKCVGMETIDPANFKDKLKELSQK